MTYIKIFHKDLNTPYEKIIEIIHDAFKERLEQNLKFSCANISIDEYKNKVKDSFIFVVFDDDNNPIGTSVLTIKKKFGIKYGLFEYLAVSTHKKRCGIGKLLMKECIDFAKKENIDCLTSSTADGAVSSVKAHKQNGFKIYMYRSFTCTNYYSFCFIRPIKKTITISVILLFRPLLYAVSYILCKVLKDKNGQFSIK